MAKFAGKWKFLNRSNNEKILEIFGTPKEMGKKILEGMETVNTECSWDAGTKTLTVSNKVADMANNVKMQKGESFPVGPHAPGWTGVVLDIGDDFIKAKVINPEGEEIGTQESKLEGDKLYSTTILKGETAKMTLERAG